MGDLKKLYKILNLAETPRAPAHARISPGGASHPVDAETSFHLNQKPHGSSTITHNYSVSCLWDPTSARAGLVTRVRAHAHGSLYKLDGGTPDTHRQGPMRVFVSIR